jgi:putative membrane protein
MSPCLSLPSGAIARAAAALAVAAVLGCAQPAPAPPARVGTTTLTGAAPSRVLDDAQIANILFAYIAAIDDSQANAASCPDRKIAAYARLLRDEFKLALHDEESVIAREHLTPEASDVSRQIAFDSNAAENDLLEREGSDFEEAYLAREVSFQRRLVAVIDKALLPSVRSEALRAELLRVRPMVVHMLDEAPRLQTWLLTEP